MDEALEDTPQDVEHDSKELVLHRYFLQEWSILKSLLETIVATSQPDLPCAHKIRSIVDKYQEQGQLLEPFLELMVTPLMLAVRCKSLELTSDENSLRSIKPLCVVIYSLVTVCGYKSVIRFFPHHVSDLELAVALLEECHVDSSFVNSLRQESTGEMEAKCVTLLWLSILVLVPFDISTVDTNYQESLQSDTIAPLVQKIMSISMDYLSSAGPMRSTASLLLAKLLTRPDMTAAFNSFVDWSVKSFKAGDDEMSSCFRVLGTIEGLAAIFKIGSKNLLVGVIPAIWKDACALFKTNSASRSPLLRKLVIKLIQRMGLVSLPYRSAVWRYVGTRASLEASFTASSLVSDDNSANQKDEEDMNVPEIVEDIMEMLFSGLRDTDTVVRWSAAKGIGRITLRLTSTLAEEVLGSLLELFAPGEGDGSWHGACLGLAELARRGLLLPGSLLKVVPLVVKALHYDVRRGSHSVGSHVRDAAAYVCWAFGRAYSHNDMRNVFEQLAPHLLTISCYDREVNCRRAAAAAFQENIGRQGAYPNGIDIVNAADYFSLSSRTNSYIHVAVNIAQYEGYLFAFAENLLHTKINHWEKGLRELATLGLAALVKYNVDYFSGYVLEKLIPLTLSVDLCSRHGSTLAAGEVVLALYRCGTVLSTDKQKAIAGVVPAIEKARLYRGKGGEIMRAAVSRFIECISESRLILPEKTKQILLATLNENLRHPNSQIQNAAARALMQFVKAHAIREDSITPNYLNQLTNSNVAVRRGSALALAILPYGFFANCWEDALVKLSSSCLVEKNPEDRDAEARVNAVKAVVSVSEILIKARKEHDRSIYDAIKNVVIKALLEALDDYCTDNRGDVGSWVREASLLGLETCTYLLCGGDSSHGSETFFDCNVARSVIGGIIKQAVEKLDKLRVVSALVLQRMLHNKNVFVPFIPHREVLEKIIPEGTHVDWGAPSFSLPRFVSLLQYPVYSKVLLSGLVTSSGGLQDSLRKAAVSALLDYLSSDEISKNSRLCSLSTDVIWLLRHYKKTDRIIIPTLKTIEVLSSKKIFINAEDLASFLECLKVELKGAKDFSKLYCGISVVGYMSSLSGAISRDAFAYLLTFLANRYPKIRKAAADQVYLILLQNEMERGVEIVSETCWDGDVEVAKRQLSKLMQIFGFEFDRYSASLSSPAPVSKPFDENAHYSSLVDSTGF